MPGCAGWAPGDLLELVDGLSVVPWGEPWRNPHLTRLGFWSSLFLSIWGGRGGMQREETGIQELRGLFTNESGRSSWRN